MPMNYKMILSKKILLFINFFFVTGFTIAQQIKSVSALDSYRAIHWTSEDGLPFNEANTMIRDANGFLWVGSGGGTASELCRFDGAVFKTYPPGDNKRGAINSGAIYSFKEDSLHNIWMSTD
jgi:hypothetical protein